MHFPGSEQSGQTLIHHRPPSAPQTLPSVSQVLGGIPNCMSCSTRIGGVDLPAGRTERIALLDRRRSSDPNLGEALAIIRPHHFLPVGHRGLPAHPAASPAGRDRRGGGGGGGRVGGGGDGEGVGGASAGALRRDRQRRGCGGIWPSFTAAAAEHRRRQAAWLAAAVATPERRCEHLAAIRAALAERASGRVHALRTGAGTRSRRRGPDPSHPQPAPDRADRRSPQSHGQHVLRLQRVCGVRRAAGWVSPCGAGIQPPCQGGRAALVDLGVLISPALNRGANRAARPWNAGHGSAVPTGR